ncbi:MAG: hypothetical protein IJ722_03390 [Alloprevotella sp.]|nr:hypothetical protein [Alloprevotella sp.]
MDKRMNENAALPADMQAAEPCAESAPKAKKPYVKPAMKVFPLDCGLLAASGVSGPPVYLTIRGGISMYSAWAVGNGYIPCMPFLPAAISADDIMSGFAGISFPDVVSYRDCCISYPCFPDGGNDGPSVIGLPGDWDEADFLANVRLSDNPGFARDELSSGANYLEVEGSYKNRLVVITFRLYMEAVTWR